ncbi:YjbE family putative metal transport protein [Mesorhizobium sangaii]|uniref:YjbE family integral membrane protein n=1 Tax=Mesorhizobium sangaii TaxID=505389 RepID=A0A841P128_9HYPH|nr:YjbE family putative metal transport protein [Mesorhizobium sangaii]MBB6408987.1 YjbE family integral membrane protein [Mesorhizobium sangaii]
MPFGIDQATIAAYLEVVTINLVLSGDNVVVIGMAAAGLAKALRQKAIVAGIAAAAVIRIVFAVVAVQLLAIPGIMLAGGLLLFWVCWNMFGELRSAGDADDGADADPAAATHAATRPAKALRTAILQIVVADVSMSLDNVLAVAGAASDDMDALVFGLILSVVLMAVASTLVAALLARHRWIGWLGLAIIVYVAGSMVLDGVEQVKALNHWTVLSRTSSSMGASTTRVSIRAKE